MGRIGLAALCLVALLAGARPAGATVVYFALQTGIQGGQTSIDVDHSSTWSFSTGQSWTFGGGTFQMKDGPSTVADISLSLYDGSNTLVASKTLANSVFTQSFADIAFLFGTPIVLGANSNYTVKLTSNAAITGAKQYFIKGASSTLAFVDASGTPIPAGYVTSVTDTGGTTTGGGGAVPEPAAVGLLAVGLAGLGVLRARRSVRPVAAA